MHITKLEIMVFVIIIGVILSFLVIYGLWYSIKYDIAELNTKVSILESKKSKNPNHQKIHQ